MEPGVGGSLLDRGRRQQLGQEALGMFTIVVKLEQAVQKLECLGVSAELPVNLTFPLQ